MNLTRKEMMTLAEACWLAIELLSAKAEEVTIYEEEDIASMRREIEEYSTLAERLANHAL